MTEKVVIGDCTLYRADCRDVLPTLGRFDLLLTDPPYGLNAAVNKSNEEIVGDETTDIRDWSLRSLEYTSAVVFGSPKIAKPDGVHITLVWDKGPFVGMGDLSFPFKLTHEEIYILGDKAIWIGKRQESVFRQQALFPNLPAANASRGEELLHPTQKPISLMADILRKTIAQTVLDPFMGSGTTGVACVQLGRKFTGIEREPKYFDIACKRIEQAYAQGVLIPHEQPKPVQEPLL